MGPVRNANAAFACPGGNIGFYSFIGFGSGSGRFHARPTGGSISHGFHVKQKNLCPRGRAINDERFLGCEGWMMNQDKFWKEYQARELKNQRQFDRLVGAIVGMLVLGVVLLAPGCLQCFWGEGAIWEPFDSHAPTMRLVP
ncbi:MAG: hypothetical protein E4H28_08085 [Gemmatimonadales bacterium]|nr:MAG: hypothetical protein E4H28_08085 [Gemmatimonadales bacterium]